MQLWNRSLFEPVLRQSGRCADRKPVEQCELRQLLEKLPDGLQTDLGESGGLVAGGEGQRVRLDAPCDAACALLFSMSRFEDLIGISDEELLAPGLVVSLGGHDFVVRHARCWRDNGISSRARSGERRRIVEDGNPADLARQTNSRYRALLEAEESVREGSWSGSHWRHLRLEDGGLRREITTGPGMKEVSLSFLVAVSDRVWPRSTCAKKRAPAITGPGPACSKLDCFLGRYAASRDALDRVDRVAAHGWAWKLSRQQYLTKGWRA